MEPEKKEKTPANGFTMRKRKNFSWTAMQVRMMTAIGKFHFMPIQCVGKEENMSLTNALKFSIKKPSSGLS